MAGGTAGYPIGAEPSEPAQQRSNFSEEEEDRNTDRGSFLNPCIPVW